MVVDRLRSRGMNKSVPSPAPAGKETDGSIPGGEPAESPVPPLAPAKEATSDFVWNDPCCFDAD